MRNNSQQEIPENALRSALGRFPTGVAVVTTVAANGQPAGMTINSFGSVSLQPALISWCIARESASYAAFIEAGSFAVSILSEEQAELAMRFATRGANKFADIPLRRRAAPLVPDACAWFECESYRKLVLGDHAMLVGKVIDFSVNGARPLVFAGGRLQELAPNVETAALAA